MRFSIIFPVMWSSRIHCLGTVRWYWAIIHLVTKGSWCLGICEAQISPACEESCKKGLWVGQESYEIHGLLQSQFYDITLWCTFEPSWTQWLEIALEYAEKMDEESGWSSRFKLLLSTETTWFVYNRVATWSRQTWSGTEESSVDCIMVLNLGACFG